MTKKTARNFARRGHGTPAAAPVSAALVIALFLCGCPSAYRHTSRPAPAGSTDHYPTLKRQPTKPQPPPPPSIRQDAVAEKLVDAPQFAEGPSWWRESLVFAGGGLRRVDPATRKAKLLLRGSPAGTYRLRDGRLLVCDNRRKALLLLSADGRRADILANRFQGRPLRLLNDVTADAAGNIYWTDPRSFDPAKPDGNIFRLTPDGKVSRIASALSFPNGIETDPESRFLYVVESPRGRMLRYDLPASTEASLGKPTDFFRYETQGDGLTFDTKGNLWATEFLGEAVVCISPQGERLARFVVAAKGVSNLTFGGPQRDTLFVTTTRPNAVFQIAGVGVTGFVGHPGAARYPSRGSVPLSPP